jgi:hypothetical protein
MAGLRALAQELRWPGVSALQSIALLYKKNWRVYLKRPFGGPQQVLAYLANYTHRVAIANSRIREIDEATGKVTITPRAWASRANSGSGSTCCELGIDLLPPIATYTVSHEQRRAGSL